MNSRLTPVVAVLIAVSAGPVWAAPLAAHRAVYEIELDEASERSGITGMRGRMVYDFGGSACDGYTVSFRFVTQIDTEEASRLTDQQTTTFENVEEQVFQFATRSFVDQRQDRDVKGVASDGSVELSKPEERSIELADAAFPTQHTIELLKAAERGDRLYERMLFDGSDDADRVLSTTAVIGSRQTHGDEVDEDGNALPDEFGGMGFWPVSVAYYGTAEQGGGESVPLYRIEMDLYENGVARDIVMDYGDFRLKGTLSEIEMNEADACD